MTPGRGSRRPRCAPRCWRASGFPLDPFQEAAFDALDDGRSVLGVGADGLGQDGGRRLRAWRGPGPGASAPSTRRRSRRCPTRSSRSWPRCTAPTTWGCSPATCRTTADAAVVVMTTEVLRNMLFARSPQLAGLGLVVLDEVHYLQDPYRGSVWEEVHHPEPSRGGVRVPVGHGVQCGAVRRLADHRARAHRGRGREAPARRAAQPRGRGGEGEPSCRARAAAAPAQAPPPGARPRPTRGTPGPTARRVAPLASGRPAAQRAHRSARRPDHVAGHRLHLLQSRVRRRRGPVPVGRDAPHEPRGERRDPTSLRGAHRGASRRGAARPGVRAVGRGPRGGAGIAPRRTDPGLPGGGGGLLLLEPAAASCSPPRRCRSASTCRPVRW